MYFGTAQLILMLKEILTQARKALYWDINILEVQDYWNIFEIILIRVFDKVAPMTEFVSYCNHN